MNVFKKLEAIAAPLPLINIDTDMIIPKQFLRTIKRSGLGIHAFDEMRYLEDGAKNQDFILNHNFFCDAQILITGDNFGCGSSREHAPWALLDFGIQSIIAPSFADIFYNNCFKNGILPITLPQNQVDILMEHAQNQEKISIDLEKQTVSIPSKEITFSFEIDPFRKKCLLEGLDDIGLTLEKEDEIHTFEKQDKETRPWI